MRCTSAVASGVTVGQARGPAAAAPGCGGSRASCRCRCSPTLLRPGLLPARAVASELSAAGAPGIVREWITRPPTWVDVRPIAPEAVATITDDLDLGERAAIALAETVHADLLLIDEAAGRAEAKRRHLRVTGTLGVLRAGAEQGLVDVPDLLERLKTTSFFLDEALVNTVFEPWLKP